MGGRRCRGRWWPRANAGKRSGGGRRGSFGADQTRGGRRQSWCGCRSNPWRPPPELGGSPIKTMAVTARARAVADQSHGGRRPADAGADQGRGGRRPADAGADQGRVAAQRIARVPCGGPGRGEGIARGAARELGRGEGIVRGAAGEPGRGGGDWRGCRRRAGSWRRGRGGKPPGSRVVADGPRRVAAGGEVVVRRSAFGRRFGAWRRRRRSKGDRRAVAAPEGPSR